MNIFNTSYNDVLTDLVNPDFQVYTKAHCKMNEMLTEAYCSFPECFCHRVQWGVNTSITSDTLIVMFREGKISLSDFDYLLQCLVEGSSSFPHNHGGKAKIAIHLEEDGFYGRKYDHSNFEEGNPNTDYAETRGKFRIAEIVGSMSEKLDVRLADNLMRNHYSYLLGLSVMTPAAFYHECSVNAFVDTADSEEGCLTHIHILCVGSKKNFFMKEEI